MAARFTDLANIAGPVDDRPPFSFAAATRVAFSDTDAQSIVYYGRYAPYFDVARVEYFRHLGIDPHDADDRHGELVMRHFAIDYHAPAVFDDLLEVYCRIEAIGTTSLTFEYAVTKSPTGQLLATARQVMVNVDLAQRKPCPVPDRVRAAVAAFEQWESA